MNKTKFGPLLNEGKIEKPKNVKIIYPDLSSPRLLKPKKKKNLNEDISALRELSAQVATIQKTLNELILAQGKVNTNVDEIRREVFLNGLKKTLKNKKQIKKNLAAKKNKLLEKCGVRGKKAVLTTEDVERMKTRVDMV